MTSNSLAAIYQNIRFKFKNARIPTPELDARLIIADLLDIDPMHVLTEGNLSVSNDTVQKLEHRIKARLSGTPIGRILGYREFWGIELSLNDATFEPRPDTETLVECVLDWVKSVGREQEYLKIVDIGTGSGAILIALLSELPNATGIGIDISSEALSQAKKNFIRTGLYKRCYLVCSSYLDSLTGKYDLIVSNPPYIPTGEIELLESEVKDHDPLYALDGGEDGLRAYQAIIRGNCDKLKQKGRIFLEIGFNQLQSTSNLLISTGYGDLNSARDLTGNDRVISATRS